jgi:hypothetical protein
MRGIDQYNFPAFHEAAKQLRAAGYEVVSPAEMDIALGFDPNDGGEFTEEMYHAAMRRDIETVLSVDGVALLHGWRASKGANVEHDVARAVGLTAMLVESWLVLAAKQRGRVATR